MAGVEGYGATDATSPRPPSSSRSRRSFSQSPRIPHEQDDGTVRLEMKESVYSFMLFQPPLSRRNTGHYYTPEVMLAFALLLLNLTLQVGLTLIAGNRIVQTASDFSKTLVNSEEATTPWADAIDDGNKKFYEHRRHVAQRIWTDEPSTNVTEKCCDGAECAELQMPCCDRRGAAPHEHFQPMVRKLNDTKVANDSVATQSEFFLSFRKPASKKSEHGEEHKLEPTVSSLCKLEAKEGKGTNRTLVCTPLSFEFIEAWKYLDVNADGLWTLEEARTDEANLGCRLGLPVEEVFRSTCRGVQRDNEDTSANPPYIVHHIPVSVSERRAVPRAFFDWWKGLAVVCVVHDVSRCGELITRGVFDGAIKADDRYTKGGVQDLDTALDYCQRLLRPGGICEKTLPGAYMMYRSRVTEKCGPATYTTGERYANPYDDQDVMQTIKVTYSLYSQYDTAHQPEFQFFLGLILFLWYVNLVGELKAIIELADFIFAFPVVKGFPLLTPELRKRISRRFPSVTSSLHVHKPLQEKREMSWTEEEGGKEQSFLGTKAEFIEHFGEAEGLERWENASALEEDMYHTATSFRDFDVQPIEPAEKTNVITDISSAHQGTCTIMLITRLFILVYMFHVGSNFLITNHKYDDLLLNAVALAFIFELPEFLYQFLVSDELKVSLEGAMTESYHSYLPRSNSYWSLCLSKSLWGIIIIPLVVLAVVTFNDRVTTLPSLRALQCTCFQQGEHCEVASRFTRDYWNQYWQELSEIFGAPRSTVGTHR